MNSNPQSISIWCVYIKGSSFTFGIKRKRQFLECPNEFSALFPVQHPDVALADNSLLQECFSVLHQICGTAVPFDLRCESVTFLLHVQLKYTVIWL